MSAPDRYVHCYPETEEIRGFNETTPTHRRVVVVTLRDLQDREGGGHGRYDSFIAPSVVAYCTAVLAPYVAAYGRSQRTWEGLRAFEEDVSWREPYVVGWGRERLRRMMRAA